MKLGLIWIAVAAALACGPAHASAQDSNAQLPALHACSQLPADPQRIDCLKKLAQVVAPRQPAAQTPPVPATTVAPSAAGQWLVSETRSPVDYSPLAVATSPAASANSGNTLQLAIHCRGGRTEVRLMAAKIPASPLKADYAIDEGPSIPLALEAPRNGSDLTLKDDAASWLTALPHTGTVTVRLSGEQGPALDTQLSLTALQAALLRMARPCRWPAPASPHN